MENIAILINQIHWIFLKESDLINFFKEFFLIIWIFIDLNDGHIEKFLFAIITKQTNGRLIYIQPGTVFAENKSRIFRGPEKSPEFIFTFFQGFLTGFNPIAEHDDIDYD